MSQIGIRMNGGLPRFQSQVLRQLKIPNISQLSLSDKDKLIDAYNNQNLDKSNQIINKYCTQTGISARRPDSLPIKSEKQSLKLSLSSHS